MPEFWCKHHLVWCKLEIAWYMISSSGWGNSGITCLPMVLPELHAPRALSRVKVNGIFSLQCLDNMGKNDGRAFLKMECPHLQVFHFYDYKWRFLKMMMSKRLALRENLLYKLFLSDYEWERSAWSSITLYSGGFWANTILHWHTGLQISYHYAACQTGLRIFCISSDHKMILALTGWSQWWTNVVMVNWSSICSMLL